MKTKNIILIIFFILIAVSAGWWILHGSSTTSTSHTHKDIYYCPMHPQYTSDRPGVCPICAMKLVKKESSAPMISQSESTTSSKKILYWTDPMIPGYKASGPGKSPMGMDLVPVYEEPSKETSAGTVPGYAAVSVDTQKQQLIGVKTASVTKKSLVKTIHAYGYVVHDLELYEAQLEYIEAWRNYYAFFLRRSVKETYRPDWWKYYTTSPSSEGRWRSKDELQAQQRFIKAEYELRHMGLTDAQLEQLRQVKKGQPWVQPDLIFFEKDQPFWIYAQVLESDLGFIAPGQKVMATVPTYGETMEGIVRSVAPVIDPTTRTTRVRIEVPNYKGELSVNMYVNVDMPVELDESLVIPREAIMDTGLNKVVFIQTKEGVFEPRSITTGFEGDGMVAVKSGLTEGETIVVSGNFLLDSESRLQASLTGGQ